MAVPVQAIEAWVLQFGHLVNKRPTGPPQRIARKVMKQMVLEAGGMDLVLDTVLPKLGATELETLAREQRSFAEFRQLISRWT